MKGGPRQSETVPTVYSHTGISEMKSHVKKVKVGLPFGLKIASDVFQERLDRVLRLLEGVHGIADDIHMERLRFNMMVDC